MVKKFKVESVIVPFDIEKKLSKILIKKGDFGVAIDNDLLELEKKFKVNINIIKSLRSQLIKEKVIKTHYLVKKFKKNIIKDYENYDILLLSKKYDLSPMTIMRMVIENKYKDRLKKVISKLSDKDKEKLDIAESNDIVSQLDQTNVQNESLKYEEKISKVLKKKNILFKTQEDLVEEQKRDLGKAVITPDFLLEDKILINGKSVKWIEVKNFYGAYVKHFRKSVQKQVGRYYKKWGNGCVVYKHGYSDKINFEGTLIISF